MDVAIIGARRVRQGLGPYLARFVHDAGHRVTAVVGTSPESAAAAADAIHAELGIRPHPCTRSEDLHDLDRHVLIVASPHETHDPWLRHAFEHHADVLCEKPLVWGTREDAARGEHWARAFHGEELVLRVNAQWPWTLESFRALHPEAPSRPRSFRMHMPPRTHGFDALLDCLSHPLSMLAHLAPGEEAQVCDLRFEEGGPDALRWRITLRYQAPHGAIETELVFDATPDQRRTTSYALDEFAAVRTVDPASYAMTLADPDAPERSIPLPDPTPRLVRSFLDLAERGEGASIDPAAVPGMRHLVEIVEAAADHYGVPTP